MESEARYIEPSTTKSQTSDFQGYFYYKYWCHNGFLVCNSATISQHMNHGSTWSTQSTIHNVGWWGNLVPYHKVKFIGSGYDNGVTTESWISVNDHGSWVESCYDENTWNFPYTGKTHYWSVCVSDASRAGNTIYSTLHIQ